MALTYKRNAFPAFELKNDAYVNASVTFYEADTATGIRTDTLAEIWDSYASGQQLANPYTLDSDGRAGSPIFYDQPIVAVINTQAIGEHTTGMYVPSSAQFRGEWRAAEHYLQGDLIIDGDDSDNTRNLFVCDTEHTSSVWNDEETNWQLIVDVDDALAAAAAAEASAVSAAASASTASAASSSAAETLSEVSLAVYLYSFLTATTSSDPASGNLKLNNATPASATAIYISETNGHGQNIGADIASWDDSTSPSKGRLKIFDINNFENYVVYRITGTSTDNGTWQTLTVTYLSGSGSFAASALLGLVFLPTGDMGTAEITDGAYGDITITSSGATWTIGANAVSYAKMQQVSAGKRVLGNKLTGAGAVAEISLSNLLDFISDTRGIIYYRGASSWAALSPSTKHYPIISGGTGADPSYGAAAVPSVTKAASFTLELVDSNKQVWCDSASAIVVTVPPEADVAFLNETVFIVNRLGAGAVTFLAGTGVTINKQSGATLSIQDQYTSAVLTKTGTDTWLLDGNIM